MSSSFPGPQESLQDLPDDWFDDEEEFEPSPRLWRRGFLLVVALLVVVSLAAGPVSNLLEARNPPVAQNGLEVCGFDYCVVQDAIRAAGLDVETGSLTNSILTADEAVALASELAEYLQIEPLELTVVERLGGRIGGIYDPANRSIVIERPATAWVVTHEVAHAVAAGHGPDFQATLIELVEFQGTK